MNPNKKNTGFKDLTEFLLSTVKKRPSVYLMDNKLSSLKIFLSGYVVAREHNEINTSDRFLDSFEVWFLNAASHKKYTSWYTALLNECDNSEEKALTKFWEYLKIFNLETNFNPNKLVAE